jgi:hypothetical protein
MSPAETRAIVERGLVDLNMEAGQDVLQFIDRIAQGFPQYAHILGKSFAKCALRRGSPKIQRSDLPAALEDAIAGVEHSVRAEYNDAVFSPNSKAIYKQVLLACAMAAMDSENFFTPKDLADNLSHFLGRYVRSDTYNKHLVEFCETRGPVLERRGQPNRWRYRFRDPAMAPYVALLGALDGAIIFVDPDASPPQPPIPPANEPGRLF